VKRIWIVPAMTACSFAASLFWMGCGTGLKAAVPVAGNVGAGELAASRRASLPELVEAYRRMDLPFPPKGAKLVAWEPGGGGYANGKTFVARYLAFLLQRAAENRAAVILLGTTMVAVEEGRLAELKGVIRDADDTQRPTFEGGPFGKLSDNREEEDELIIAIHCEVMGYHELAKSLYDRQENANLELLAKLAVRHWKNQLLVPRSDRKLIEARVAALAADYPKLAGDLDASLRLTLKPVGPASDPLELKVEQLTESSLGQSQADKDGVWGRRSGSEEPDPTYEAIRRDILKAIPFLRSHLDDGRLTRSYVWPGGMGRPALLTVGDISENLLEELTYSGRQNESRDQLLQRIENLEKAVAAEGEEGFLKGHVLGSEPDAGLESLLLETLAAKYPVDLVPLYQRLVSEKRGDEARYVEGYSAKSKLPADQLGKVFLDAYQSADLGVRLSALWGLFDMGNAEFGPKLADALDGLQKTATGPYWTSREAAFGYLIIRTTDAKAWQAFNRWADRADVGLRMELLNFMNYRGALPENLAQRMAFCRRFLGDDRIRRIADDPVKFGGPCAGFGYDTLAVSDFAAMQLCALLGIDDAKLPQPITSVLKVTPEPEGMAPEPAPNQAVWRALQTRVREALRIYDSEHGK
jgi:hypothetical protein